MGIKVDNVSKSFKNYTALKNVNLEVNTGELIALLGPSGSGKTTLLRIIAGLESATSGKVYNFGKEISLQDPDKRGVGFVFQHYALFRHMTVFENIAFGLKMQPKAIRLSKTEIKEKVFSLLKLIHLEKLHDRYPKNLSGGQRQRVALARSLAVEPKILLLDEPFGALDFKVRKELRRWLRSLHEKLNITTVFVTHDQEEAMEVANRVVIMSEGNIEQIGTPAEVYHQPVNSFVYDFLGNFNVFLGWKKLNNEINIIEYQSVEKVIKKSGWFKKGKFASNIFKLLNSKKEPEDIEINSSNGNYVEIFVRPHDIEVVKTPEENKEYIPVKLTHLNPAGALMKLELERSDGSVIYAEISRENLDVLQIKINEKLFARAKEFTVFE